MTAQAVDTKANNGVAVPEPKKNVALMGPVRGLDEMWRLATALAASHLIPQALQNKPNDVLVTVMYGQELGLAPMQAMQVIDVVKGKPFIRANLWVALTRRAGHKVRVIEQTAEQCTVEVTRSDDPDFPMPATYTMEDAKTAGLVSNDNYRKNPKAMLYARAASTAIRQAAPEVALGFGDEAEAMIVRSEREDKVASLGQVAAQRETAPAEATKALVVDAEVKADVLRIAAEHAEPVQDALPVEDPPADPWDGIEVAQPPADGGQ